MKRALVLRRCAVPHAIPWTRTSAPAAGPSYLYVPGQLGQTQTALLVPHLDHLEARLASVEQLERELEQRGVVSSWGGRGGLRALLGAWRQFRTLRDLLEAHELRDSNQRRQVVEKGNEGLRDSNQLAPIPRARLKELKAKFNELETTLVPALLALPNALRVPPLLPGVLAVSKLPPPTFGGPLGELSSPHATPMDQRSPPLADMVPHADLEGPPKLGAAPSTVGGHVEALPVGPGSVYLSGALAELEWGLDQWWGAALDRLGFLRQSNPDFTKGAVVEGCGGDPQRFLKIQDSDLFLVGGASLPAYLGYFARRAVKNPQKFLPQKLYTCQRVYGPPSGESWPLGPYPYEGDPVGPSPSGSCVSNEGIPEGSPPNRDFSTNIPKGINPHWPTPRGGEDGIPSLEESALASRDKVVLESQDHISSRELALESVTPRENESLRTARTAFESLQSTRVSALVATAGSENDDEFVSEIVTMMTKAYEELGVHFRLVRCGPSDLRQHESEALSLQMLTSLGYEGQATSDEVLFSAQESEDVRPGQVLAGNGEAREDNSRVSFEKEPFSSCTQHNFSRDRQFSPPISREESPFPPDNPPISAKDPSPPDTRRYVEVGRVSALGPYASRRLLLTHATSAPSGGRGATAGTHAFLRLIYAQLMDVSRFVGLLAGDAGAVGRLCRALGAFEGDLGSRGGVEADLEAQGDMEKP